MKSGYIPLLFLFCAPILGVAQLEHRGKVIIGTETSGQVSLPSASAPSSFPEYHVFRFAPHVDFQLHKGLYAGVQAEYAYGKVEQERLDHRKGYGIKLNYFYRNHSRFRLIRDRILPYSEISWNLLNYTIDYNAQYGNRLVDGFSNHNIQVLTGIGFRLFNYLYLDYALRTNYYSENNKYIFAQRVGMQYHFGEKRSFMKAPEIPEIGLPSQSEKLNILDFSYFLKRTTFTGRYSFIFDDPLDSGDPLAYKENSFSFLFLVSISSDIEFGLSYHPILVKERFQPGKYYYMVGPVLQYDFIRNPVDMRIFAETGFYKGNLCICGDSFPYEEGGLSFIPVGMGLEKSLFKSNLFLSLSGHLYYAVNSKEKAYTPLHYTAGLSYKFFDKVNR